MTQESKPDQGEASSYPEVNSIKPTDDTPYIQPIIGKLGWDTREEYKGLFGLGASPNNGVDFHVFMSFDGINFDGNAIDNIWNNGAADKVKQEIDSATAEIPNIESTANEAVKRADSAVAASKVNSDAQIAMSSAVAAAQDGVNSAAAAIQQTMANAASDAAKIRADVAQVQSEVDTAKAANSASVEALKSDIGSAKKDLADVHDSLDKAQSAIEQNQKLINDSVAKITSDVSATKQDLATVHDSLTKAQAAAEQNQKAIDKNIAQINDSVDATNQDLAGVRKDLTKAQSDITANQKSINNNVAQINSDIAQDRKDIASAQQANADTAKQLDTYSKQAAEQGKTIKSIQDKQDGFTATLADVQGNVSQVSDKVDGLSANLKDAQDNVASVKAQADQLSATLTDHAKSIATLTASAKELSSTLEDADGRLNKVEQTAQTNSSTLSDVQGDLSQVKQNATKLVSTLKDAQGNISTLQQKADSLSTQLASAQGDIATLQTGIDGVKATLTSHDKSIHTLQADSKSLKDSMVNAQGDISTLRKTATDVTSELEDHTGRLSKVEQSAATQATTLSDLQGNLSQVKQQADGLVTTLKDAQGDITQIQQKADGTLAQLKSAQGDIASLQTNITGIKATLTSHEGDIHTLQADSKTLKDDMQDAQGNISSLQKSSTKLDSEFSSQDGRLSKVEQTAKEHTSTISDLGKKVDSNGGGVNLLTNTQSFDYNWTWDQIGHSFANDVLTLSDTNNGNSRIYQGLAGYDTTGKTFSLSFNARISADCNNQSVQVKAGPYDAPKLISITSKDFQPYKVENWQWTGQSGTFSFYVAGGKIDITNLKLEYGAVATPYSLAPGDLATISQVKQTADGIETTLKSAQGDIDQIKQTAKGTSEQLSNVQGNVTSIQKDVDGLKQTTADNAGNIHTLQSDSKSLHDSMQDVQGNISTLQKTSTDVTSELQDHAGRISKVEQTASTLTNEFSDQDGRLSKVEQTATGTQQTVANQQGQINSIQTDVSGIHETITGQGNQITTINATLNGLDTKYEGVSGDLNNLKSQAQWVTVTDTVDLNNIKTPCHEFLKGAVTNAPNETAWWYLTVEGSEGDRITQTVIADQSNNRYTRRFADSWSAWVRDATQTDITALSNSITTNSTQITQNKQAIALKADQSTVDNLSGEVSQNTAQLKVQADQISSKVSSEDFSALDNKVGSAIAQIDKNTTAIDQNSKQISLKADQTEVDSVKNTATNNSSRLDVMANEIQSKVTSTDVNNIVDSKGYATTSTVQSLITQKAGTINESIVKLDQTVKQGAENNVQLVRKSDFEDDDKGGWDVQTVVATDPPAELGQSGMKVLQTNVRDSNEDDIWYSVKPGENFDIDFWCKPSTACPSQFGLTFVDQNHNNFSWYGITTDQPGQWKHYTGTITAPANASFAKPWFQMDKDPRNTTDTALLAKPSIRRQNATTVAAIQQITASIDGIQSTVANKADKSQITQLSNAIQSKVSTADFNSKITQLSNDINLRVTKGNVLSQINLEAGRALIQSNKIYLDANSVVFGANSQAFIPSAAIENLDASKLTFYGADNTYATMGASVAQYDNDKTKSTINLQYDGGIEIHASSQQGSILTMHDNTIRLASKTWGDNPNAYQYSGFYAAPNYSLMNTYHRDGTTSGVAIDNDRIWIYGGSKNQQLGALQADVGWYSINGDTGLLTGNQITLKSGNTQATLTDNNININNASDTNSKNYDVGIHIKGWAEMTGWFTCMGLTQTSLLSTKTRIEPLDTKVALDKIVSADVGTYQFKADVAKGKTKRHASVIIDDVHDVAEYYTPDEFISEDRKGRDDGDIVGYLMGAVQELKKQLDKVKEQVNNG